MYDQPSAQALIDAALMHLETAVAPALRADRKLYFQTLVAINVLKIVGRELTLSPRHIRDQWMRLNALDGGQNAPPADMSEAQTALAARNHALCEAIREGKFDDNPGYSALLDHVTQCASEQLEVANPRLLQRIANEDQNASNET